MSNPGGPSNGSFDPSIFNTASNTSGTGLTPAIAATLSNTQSSNLSLNPTQVQQLTEFHRQQQQQRPVHPRPPPSAPAPVPGIPLPEHIRQHLRTLAPGTSEAFFRTWMTTDEGKEFSRVSNQLKLQRQAELAKQRPIAAASASPGQANSALPTSGPSGQNSAASSSTATPERRGSNPVPITSAFTPAQQIQPRPQAQQTQSQAQPPNPQLHPSLTRPSSGVFNSSPASSQWSSNNLPYRQASDYRYQHTPVPARRREDGMRGTMRSEIARLMYASGDVENPDTDTIDYMEDLVVDWLADLCAPPPPVRPTPSAPYTTPRLDYEIIRHRLSRPSMRKYLDRFEYMEYKAVDMRSARRVARGNFEPVDQKDLDGQLEKGFLDGENEIVAKKKKKVKKGTGAAPDNNAGEKKKPGPKKGWKRGGRRGESGSVKPEEGQ